MTLGEALTGAGWATGVAVFAIAAHQRRLATEGMRRIALAALVGGVIGARLSEWAVGHFDVLRAHPEVLLSPAAGGRSLLGGIIGGWIAVEIAKHRMGIRRSTGDLFALALAAGECVGRLGCFANGCCRGIETTVPWAIGGRHPAQLYASFCAAALFALLCTRLGRERREGELFDIYLVGYGASRFVLEFFRDHDGTSSGLTIVQWLCLAAVAYGGAHLMSHASGSVARDRVTVHGTDLQAVAEDQVTVHGTDLRGQSTERDVAAMGGV